MSGYIMGETGSRGNSQTGVLSYRDRQRRNRFNTAMMHKLVFCCLIIISFSCPLSSLPIINASEMSYQLAADEDSRLSLEQLGNLGSTSLLQFLPELLGTLTEDSKAGVYFPAGNIYHPTVTSLMLFDFQTFYGNHPRIALLGRFLTKDRKQYKKRGNLSECFWKYCV
ncbi:urotensin-2 [Athene cunicularia]|uniref:urotensin-2 n=1 Tax=Athene cunicularia TaxID=194338 RepID=UPI000EF67B0A|nr:urotensin-2 [Athene cunicularia]